MSSKNQGEAKNFYQNKTVELTGAAVREVVAEKKPAVQMQEELLQKADKIKATMEEQCFKLTGQKNEIDVDGLYRNMLRQMMQSVGLLSGETHAALKKEYQEQGKIIPLGRAQKTERVGMVADGEKQDLEIPAEAAEFEDMAMFFIKNYCEKEHLVTSVFLEQLASFASSHTYDKKLSEMETTIQKDVQVDNAVHINTGTVNEAQAENKTFDQMVAQKKSNYITSKGLVEGALAGEKKGGSHIQEAFQKFTSDPRVAADLKSVVEKYGRLYGNAADLVKLQSPELTFKQADILGLPY